MRIRRSVARTVGMLVFPAICAATIAYFGYFTIFGPRGLMALADARRDLAAQQTALATAEQSRLHLQHRVVLLGKGDPDIVEELRRDQNLGARTGEVSVRRNDGR